MSDQAAATSGHEAPTTAATAAVTVEQAAAILGVSVTTVKRRIRAGSLRAEQAQRPQGTVWLVYLDAAAMPAAEERPSAASVAATAAATAPAPAEAMVSLIQTTIGTVLGPLVGELAASRQANERLVGELREVERQNGELRAENRALTASTAPQSVELTTEAPTARPASTTWLTPQRFWLIAALVLVLIGVGVVQVAVALYSLAVQVAMPG